MKLPESIASVGIHEKTIREKFNDKVYYRGDAPVFDGPLVLLAFVNRSGSNLLASHMRTVPRLAGFHEQLNWTTVLNTSERQGISNFPDYIQHATTLAQKPDKIYGFKASWDQMLMLLRFGIDRMYTGVNVVHITREDIVGQAISLLIASQTEQWTSKQTAREDVTPKYDETRITNIINDCSAAAEKVRLVSQMSGARYLSVTYEQVVENPALVIRQIGRSMGAKLPTWQPKPVPLERQANALNDEWRSRYLAAARAALIK